MASFILDNLDELRARIRRSRAASVEETAPTPVFVFWDHPETMPAIVRAARETMRQHVGGSLRLVELTDTNLGEWVDIDPAMRAKMRAMPAHFSDYLRVKLLQRHGGLWLDSTCYLTADLDSATRELRAAEFFLFRYAGSRTGSWFLWSRADSYQLHAVDAVMELWWEREARLTNYFMWHDIVEMLYWTDSTYRSAWDRMPKVHPRTALQLLAQLKKPYDEEQVRRISEEGFVQKLTHKLPVSVLQGQTTAARLIDGW